MTVGNSSLTSVPIAQSTQGKNIGRNPALFQPHWYLGRVTATRQKGEANH